MQKKWVFVFGCVLFLLSACRSSQNETCQNNSDCKEGVCAFGKCQECAENSDCQAGMICDRNQCVVGETVPVTTESSNALSDENNNAMTTSCEATGTVYFDFDVYELKSEGRTQLESLAECLRGSSVNIIIEGHTDERGTVEYNLALGEKRAKAAASYLKDLGVDASRVKVVSYGKEKPVDTEHNEAAWAKNRRSEIKVD